MALRRLLIFGLTMLGILFGTAIGYITGFDRGVSRSLSPTDYIVRRNQVLSRHKANIADEMIEIEQAYQPDTSGNQVVDQQQENNPQPLSQICANDWQTLSATELEELEATVFARDPVLSSTCENAMREQIESEGVQYFIRNCHQQLSSIDVAVLETECLPLVSDLRAYAIRYGGVPSAKTDETSLEDLRYALVGAMEGLKTASIVDVRRNIQIADEMIQQYPNSYAGYKAKLLNLFVLEAKHSQVIEMETYLSLYDQLLEFRETQPAEGLGRAGDFERSTAAEVSTVDPDLVHFPFLRLASLKEYDQLSEMAMDYIAVYPNSYIGYLYAADALWNSGDQRAAVATLKEAFPEQSSSGALATLFERYQESEPIEKVYEMDLGLIRVQ